MSCYSNPSIDSCNSCLSIYSDASSFENLDNRPCTKSNYEDTTDSQYTFVSSYLPSLDSCTSCYCSPDELEFLQHSNSTSSITSVNRCKKNTNPRPDIKSLDKSTETLCYDSEATEKMLIKSGLEKNIENFTHNELSLSTKRLPPYLVEHLGNKKIEIIEITDQVDLKIPNCHYYSTIFFIDNGDSISSFVKDFYQSQEIKGIP
uniref:Ras-associating domain-containing protein n=1 Tax=Strongyloides papillosus TaxID=174720 RepID=A0A0N5B6K4_STREA